MKRNRSTEDTPRPDEKIRVKNADGRDRISLLLYVIYAFVLLASVLIIGKIIYVQFIWSPAPELVQLYRPRSTQQRIEPMRGSILSTDGSVIAVTAPAYEISMDPSIRRKEFGSREDGKALEQEWRTKLHEMCQGVATLYGGGIHDADWYYRKIIALREQGKKHFMICRLSDYPSYEKFMELPLVNEGRYKSGVIVRQVGRREYPYGTIARSIVGRIGSPDPTNIENRMNEALAGSAGFEYRKKTDRGRYIHDFDSTDVKVVDGSDVRTTIDMKLQLMLDTTLRMKIDTVKRIEAASALILDVKTGAVRAMVNLTRDDEGIFRENVNNLLKRTGEPGSVFKSVAVAAAMSYGYVTTVEDTVPTNHGMLSGFGFDDHVRKFERDSARTQMPLSEGLKVSSNNVFAYMITKYFGDRPQEYYQRLTEWNLDAPIATDLGNTVSPAVTTPQSKYWSLHDLGTIGFGYTIRVTPLHIATFYNAIANDGKMMRPYFIEDIERDGEVIERFYPEQIATVCSPAMADTLTRALKRVTEKGGTAYRLEKAPWKVAAKTGTARIYLTREERGGSTSPYETTDYRRKNQGTIVCFFPADDPKYTLLVTMYSYLSRRPLYGGTEPAQVVMEVIRRLYASEPESGEAATQVKAQVIAAPEIAAVEAGQTPDVTGLTVKDAVYELESRGFSVHYTGSGHVKSQRKAGERTIELILQ